MKVTAVVLAGKRDGSIDPLAAEAGVPLKCLVPLLGEPLIAHVVRALAASNRIGQIRIVAGDHDLLRACVPQLTSLLGERMSFVPASFNIADSVLAAAEQAEFPLLVTTADNVLLTPASVDEFVDGAERAAEGSAVGAAVAMARPDAVLAAHPQGQRSFYAFSDGGYSNCNAYWIGHTGALPAVETFWTGERFARQPMRAAGAFGVTRLLRLHFGIGTAEAFFRRLSHRFRVPLRMIELSDAACAIRVDSERSYSVARTLLKHRQEKWLAA